MFYEIEIQKLIDGSEAKAIYSYEDRGTAISVFHQKMASGIKSDSVLTVLNMVINNIGTIEKEEYYEKSIESEPEHLEGSDLI